MATSGNQFRGLVNAIAYDKKQPTICRKWVCKSEFPVD